MAGTSGRPLTENGCLLAKGERCWLVRLGDIRLFESDGNQTRVSLGSSEKPRINRSLNQLEAKLDERVFFHTRGRHRGYAIAPPSTRVQGVAECVKAKAAASHLRRCLN